MVKYVDEILAAWDSKVEPKIDKEGGLKRSNQARKMKTSAPPENLFKVDDDCKKLNLKKATAFHNIIVAKALYITKPRPDIFKLSHLASHEVLPLRYKRITIDSWWR